MLSLSCSVSTFDDACGVCEMQEPDRCGDCEEDFFCDYDATGGPRCAPLLSEGEECEDDDQCTSDLCAGVCSTFGKQGDPCDFENPCKNWLTCLGGTCWSAGDVGQGCDPFEVGSCKVSLTCQDGVCVEEEEDPLDTLGDECVFRFSCAKGTYCNFDTDICEAEIPEGATVAPTTGRRFPDVPMDFIAMTLIRTPRFAGRTDRWA